MKFIFFFALSLISFTSLNGDSPEKEGKCFEYVPYIEEAMFCFLKKAYKEHGFECITSGRLGGLYKVEGVSVHFGAAHPATIDEARELEVILREKFRQIVNEHEKVRPFLREYPFPPDRVTVLISFPNKPGKMAATNDKVSIVFPKGDRICYQAEHPIIQNEMIDLKDELYEEARAIVFKDLPKNDPKSKGTF